jgi:hypothetical protein
MIEENEQTREAKPFGNLFTLTEETMEKNRDFSMKMFTKMGITPVSAGRLAAVYGMVLDMAFSPGFDENRFYLFKTYLQDIYRQANVDGSQRARRELGADEDTGQ